MSDATARDDAPVVFHDGVLVDTVSPLRSLRPSAANGLFRVDYFGRGIAVAYGHQLKIISPRASPPSPLRPLRAEGAESPSLVKVFPTALDRVHGRSQLSHHDSFELPLVGGAA